MSVSEAYDPDSRWGRVFGWRPPKGQPNPYRISGYHRGQDVRKLDQSGSFSVVTDVVSLSSGRVSHVYMATSTGREIVVDTGRDRGRYEIHCHNASFPNVGLIVDAGGFLARNAAAGQRPGTAWSGPHDHFVISDFPDAAHNDRPVYDPRDFIRDALANPAETNARLFEEDFMATLTDDEKRELFDAIRLIPAISAVFPDSVFPNLNEIKATGNGLNEKIGWVLATLERQGGVEADQSRALAALAAALPTAGGVGAPVDLTLVMEAIAANHAAIAATPAAVRAELAERLSS